MINLNFGISLLAIYVELTGQDFLDAIPFLIYNKENMIQPKRAI